MSVAEVARTMAQQTLEAAIVDVGAVHVRHDTINRGLVGAVLNALDKGLTEAEITVMFRDLGDSRALHTALAEHPDEITEQHRGVLERLLRAVHLAGGTPILG